MPRNPNCTRCPLHETANEVCVWGNGSAATSGVMLVGEAPGETEDRTGLPFQGQSGRALNQALTAAGLKREDVYVSNAVRCRPPGNRDPLPSEVAACFPYLVEELAEQKPKVVVAVGNSALKVLAGKGTMAKARGMTLTPAIRLPAKTLLTATYHPAFYLRQRVPSVLQAIVDDLKLAASLASQGGQQSLPAHDVTVLPPGFDSDTLTAALAPLQECRVVSVDCEWTAATDRRMAWPWTKGAEMYSVSISGASDRNTITSVAIGWPDITPDCLQIVQAFLKGRKQVYHNAMADLIWLFAHNIPVMLAGDTMVLAHLMNEEAELKLSTLALSLLGMENWKQPLWSTRPQSQEVWEELLTYCATDTFATLLVAEALYRKLWALPNIEERDNILRFYGKHQLRVIPVYARMALRGMPMNRRKLATAIQKERQYLDDKAFGLAMELEMPKERAAKLATSPLQVKQLLHNVYGIDVETTGGTTVDSLSTDYPAIGFIQEIKHSTKLLGTYLEPWYDLITEQDDDRLHSVYRITSSRTGRTSAELEKGGSLQLVPRENWIRRLVAPKPGRLMYVADQSQLELRIAAWLADEPTMLRLFREGADLHRATAAVVARIPQDQVTKEQRQIAKAVNFGLLFGMGADKFRVYARTQYGVEMSEEEAYAAREAFFGLYPGLRAWHRRCERDFERGYTVTPMGRYRRSLPDLTKAINTPVQAMGTDLTALAMVEIDAQLRSHPYLEAFLCGFVHDSVEIEGPQATNKVYEQEIVHIIKQSMEHPPLQPFGITELGVPLLADVTIGPSWGEAE